MQFGSGLFWGGCLVASQLASAGIAQGQVYVEQVSPSARPSTQAKVFIQVPDPLSGPGEPRGPAGYGGSANQPVASGASGNRSSILQSGAANVAAVVVSGSGNVTSQVQNGTGNQSSLSVTGTDNAMSLVQQGNANASNLSLMGNNNAISTTQIGTGSSYTLQHVGNGQSVSVTQVR